MPVNYTAYDRLDQMPTIKKSQEFQTEAKVALLCNKTIPTSMEWLVFQIELVKDPLSEVGMKESLTEYPIKETVPSYNQLQLNMPPRTLEKGVYKLVFIFEVRFSASFSIKVHKYYLPLD